ncbi:hypothetical protein X945_6019 [Burkholderia pseudomallei ABCPW 107]|nr:hypothetical protein X945_6019 [Burkholderia pseudomallei ABCPW 107]
MICVAAASRERALTDSQPALQALPSKSSALHREHRGPASLFVPRHGEQARNPCLRLRRLRCLTRNFVIYGLFAEQLLKLTNLLEGIAQIRRWHNFFAGTDC